MTNFWQDNYDKRIKEFSTFLFNTNMSQTKAAELLDVSRGQLSHLLKYERTLNDFIYNRMKYIIEKKEPQKVGGIYGIYYKDELVYIGKTKNFKQRFSNHKSAIKNCIQDGQPFHQSKLDIAFLSQKILYSCEKKFLYPQEINRLEEFFIRVCLPEWNTNILTLSAYKETQDEKIQYLVEIHPTHLKLLQYELDNYKLPISEECNILLKKANNYSLEEIVKRATQIISHNKVRITKEEKEKLYEERRQALNQK